MRKLLVSLLILAMLLGVASAGWYPQKINQGMSLQTNTGASNAQDIIAVQTIPAVLTTTLRGAESSDDDQLFTAVPANNTTHIIRTSSGNGSSTFLAQPDVPRNIIVTPSGAVTGSLKITGTDIANAVITSNLTFSGSGIVAGLRAFKTVTRIDGTFTQTTGARTLKIGTGDVLGLNTKLSNNTVLMDVVGATKDTVAPVVTVSPTVLSLNTIDTTTAPGGYVTRVYFMVPA